jgi:hypothetical protein
LGGFSVVTIYNLRIFQLFVCCLSHRTQIMSMSFQICFIYEWQKI